MVARLWKLTALFLIPILHQTTTNLSTASVCFELFLIPILHQTTTDRCSTLKTVALFLIPILHQTTTHGRLGLHNFALFLIPILHQTTTSTCSGKSVTCCSSFQFYIKPQPCPSRSDRWQRCSSFQFYIKPQPIGKAIAKISVVPHSNSTSNHNGGDISVQISTVVPHSNSTSNHNDNARLAGDARLFLIPILHQTTTRRLASRRSAPLFLIPILHQTTTSCRPPAHRPVLFLIPILHQTTTVLMRLLL